MHFALTMIQFSVVNLATNCHNPVVWVSLMKSQPICVQLANTAEVFIDCTCEFNIAILKLKHNYKADNIATCLRIISCLAV